MLTALKIDPNNADAYFQLGSLYARNNLLEKALAHLKSAVELSPKSARYHWGLGVAYSLQGQQEDALTEFLQSTVIDENFTEGFIALARPAPAPRRPGGERRRRSSGPRRPSPRTRSCSPRAG